MAFKQGFTGAKGTKVCQENIPTQLNYQQQPKPLIKNRTDSSFHVVYNKSNRLVSDFPQQKSRLLRPANVRPRSLLLYLIQGLLFCAAAFLLTLDKYVVIIWVTSSKQSRHSPLTSNINKVFSLFWAILCKIPEIADTDTCFQFLMLRLNFRSSSRPKCRYALSCCYVIAD